MNLADMLTFADIGQLSRIANHYQCSCNGNSKHELIQSILQTIGHRGFIERHIAELSLADLRFLNMLLFDGRKQFSLEELIACAGQSRYTEDNGEQENPRDTIARFRKQGWLFQGRTQNTRYLFEVPEDLKRRFRETLERQFKSEVVKIAGEPTIYREEPELMANDFILLLQYVQHHDIQLNNEGVMYRRNQLQIMEKLHVSEALVGKGWRFGYGRRFKDYPSRLALLYDYAYHRKLITENKDKLVLTPAGQSYLDEDKRESMIHLVSFWLRLYKGAIPNLFSLVFWSECCSKEWVTVTSLYEVIGPLIRPFYYDTSASIFDERLLRMLLHLGMIRMGENEQGVRFVQATPFGAYAVQYLHKGTL